MIRTFNVSGDCKPALHYMVNIKDNLEKIKKMIDQGLYFTMNRARQYGKTTTLRALDGYLKDEYMVISLDFQKLSYADFNKESSFVSALSREILKKILPKESVPEEIKTYLNSFKKGTDGKLADLFSVLSNWCARSDKPIVLIIDEVDSATNNQVFLDFLAQVRSYYIDRDVTATFHSVILAGVYDVKNLKRKFVSEGEHKFNSPWNIAADFSLDMSFSSDQIEGMIREYERDHKTGMNIKVMSELISEYTSGYPFLVSMICKLIDERVELKEGQKVWSKEGFLEALRILLTEKNTLFESLVNKLTDYPELREMLYSLLFTGKMIPYNTYNEAIDVAQMFGFVKNKSGMVAVSNRIFEIVLYNLFLSEESLESPSYKTGLQEKNQFIRNGRLNMKRVLKKFIIHFDDLYGDKGQEFLEEDGRRYFLLFLKPIINGTGNYYIESQTRNMERTDVIVDYNGEQFVVELKIWHGNSYNNRGEKQLMQYLDYYHLDKGYMLSFNFNQKKEIGVRELTFGDKTLVEGVV